MTSFRTTMLLACGLAPVALLALDPHAPPGANFDLTHWKLTLPIGDPRRPTEVGPDGLAGTRGYTSRYFFTDPADGAMVFSCPGHGVTTRTSPHPRTELREEIDGRHDNSDWTIGQFALSELTATCRVEKVGPHHRVIVGQIHGVGYPVVKLVYDYNAEAGTGALIAQINQNDAVNNRQKNYPIAEGIPLNHPFSYMIRTTSDGRTASIQTVANGDAAREATVDEPAWIHAATNGIYFKAGNYCQETTSGKTEDGCVVAFLALHVRHEGPL